MQKVNILGYTGETYHNTYTDRWWVNFRNKNHNHFQVVDCIISYLYGPKYQETSLTTLALKLGLKIHDGCFPEFTCKEDLMTFVKYIQNPLIRFQNV